MKLPRKKLTTSVTRVQTFASCAIIIAAALCAGEAGAERPQEVSIRIDDLASPLNTFTPAKAFGGAFDGHPKDETMPVFTKANIAAIKSSGLEPISYRLRTELGIQVWHWNPRGHWSDDAGHQGYWTSDDESSAPLDVTHGYFLPRRGSTVDQADQDSYSRLVDGDPETFWKSNPYLDQTFTGESNREHPQWIIIDLGELQQVNALEILWGFPFATRFSLQYSTENTDDLWSVPLGGWQNFPGGTASNGNSGRQLVRLGRAPAVRFVRILLLDSSGPAAGYHCGDPRDCLGFAVRELRLGTLDSSGHLTDLLAHAKRAADQTSVTVSSTDPWHREQDLSPDAEQPGFDLMYKSELVGQRPMLLSFGLLYDTPENAAAALRFLRSHHYPIAGIELGEEPDGQNVEPEDYGALYVQWVRALRQVDPQVHIGGPSFQTGIHEHQDFRSTPDPSSWLSRFLAYLKRHGMENEFQFFSFEWYPFDQGCVPPGPQLAQSAGLLRGQLQEWLSDGLRRDIPWYITELHYSPFAGPSGVEIQSALLNAETAALFLSLGGTTAYFYQVEPGTMIREPECNGWGNQLLFLADRDGQVRARLSSYWAARIVSQIWSQPGDQPHTLYPVTVDLDQPLGRERLSVFTVKRPDGRWSTLAINKNPSTAFHARISLRGAKDPASYTQQVFSSNEYVWHADGPNGTPLKSDSPSRHSSAGNIVDLPPFSISVIEFEAPPAS